jgi:hypothetical protein
MKDLSEIAKREKLELITTHCGTPVLVGFSDPEDVEEVCREHQLSRVHLTTIDGVHTIIRDAPDYWTPENIVEITGNRAKILPFGRRHTNERESALVSEVIELIRKKYYSDAARLLEDFDDRESMIYDAYQQSAKVITDGERCEIYDDPTIDFSIFRQRHRIAAALPAEITESTT